MNPILHFKNLSVNKEGEKPVNTSQFHRFSAAVTQCSFTKQRRALCLTELKN